MSKGKGYVARESLRIASPHFIDIR